MNMSFGEGILCSILGMLVVFFGLVCLQVVIKLVGVIAKPGKAAADSAPAAVPAAAPAAAAAAPGTAGEIKLYGTSPGTPPRSWPLPPKRPVSRSTSFASNR